MKSIYESYRDTSHRELFRNSRKLKYVRYMKILIAPLNWGLGHASRCVPVIRELQKRNADVSIAASGRALALLKKEFPQLTFIDFPDYNIHYSSNLIFGIIFQIPKILFGIFREHRQLEKIIREYHIDAVISDNRFGLWSRKVHTVFITHQVMLKCPKPLKFSEPLLYKLNSFFIKKFDECWIPDVEEGNNLSGDLSHKFSLPKNAKYVGWLSRFSNAKLNGQTKKYNLAVIISGPEPQRTAFEKAILNELKKSPELKTILVRGIIENGSKQFTNENITIADACSTLELSEIISESEIVVSRSGYSTIMDLIALKKKAILIPTKGQTEQEYLAKHLSGRNLFYCVDEKRFQLKEAIEKIHEANPDFMDADFNGYKKAIEKLLKNFHNA